MSEPIPQDYALVVGNSLEWSGKITLAGGDLLTTGTVLRCTVRHPYTRAVLTQLVGTPGDSSGGITIVDGLNYSLKFTPAMTAQWPVHKPGCPYDVQVSRGSSKSYSVQFGRIVTERGITLSRTVEPTKLVYGVLPPATAAYSGTWKITDVPGALYEAFAATAPLPNGAPTTLVPIGADLGVMESPTAAEIQAVNPGDNVRAWVVRDQSGYEYPSGSVGGDFYTVLALDAGGASQNERRNCPLVSEAGAAVTVNGRPALKFTGTEPDPQLTKEYLRVGDLRPNYGLPVLDPAWPAHGIDPAFLWDMFGDAAFTIAMAVQPDAVPQGAFSTSDYYFQVGELEVGSNNNGFGVHPFITSGGAHEIHVKAFPASNPHQSVFRVTGTPLLSPHHIVIAKAAGANFNTIRLWFNGVEISPLSTISFNLNLRATAYAGRSWGANVLGYQFCKHRGMTLLVWANQVLSDGDIATLNGIHGRLLTAP